MEYMHRLKDMLCEELKKLSSQDINEKNLEYIDKLAHAIKSIVTIMAMESGGSSYDAYDRGYYRGSRRGRGNYSRDDGYSGYDGSYDRDYNRSYDGNYDRSYDRSYDGNYSRDMASSLDKLMQTAKSPKEKEIIKAAMRQLESAS